MSRFPSLSLAFSCLPLTLSLCTAACVTTTPRAPTAPHWVALDPSPAEPAPRSFHTAVWTGDEMIVWGGLGYDETATPMLASGGRYAPERRRWRATTPEGAPVARHGHSAVWTGRDMIVWGGTGADRELLRTGARYDPATDRWQPMTLTGAPTARTGHQAVWLGDRMLVWGGHTVSGRAGDGAFYDPASDAWRPLRGTLAEATRERTSFTMIATAMGAIAWGGHLAAAGDRGFVVDRAGERWQTLAEAGAPSKRASHAAVWTGREMVVWGGASGGRMLGDGGVYDPEADAWRPMSNYLAPTPRSGAAAIWAGDAMIVWGGKGARVTPLATGGAYDPVSDTWRNLPTEGAPVARFGHTAVFTGRAMIVWGGFGLDASGTQSQLGSGASLELP